MTALVERALGWCAWTSAAADCRTAAWRRSPSRRSCATSRRWSTRPGSSASRSSAIRRAGRSRIEYAVRHPERVTPPRAARRLCARPLQAGLAGRAACEELEAQLKLVEFGWGRDDDPSYRQLFASQFMPGATLEQLRSLSELQRVSAYAARRGAHAAGVLGHRRLQVAFRACALPDAGAPRARRPARAVRGGARLAAIIPDARFVPLESDNHILLEHEPAFAQFFEELQRLLPGAPGGSSADASPTLTAARGADPGAHRAGPATTRRSPRVSTCRKRRCATTSPASSTRSASRAARRPSSWPGSRVWDGSPSFSSPRERALGSALSGRGPGAVATRCSIAPKAGQPAGETGRPEAAHHRRHKASSLAESRRAFSRAVLRRQAVSPLARATVALLLAWTWPPPEPQSARSRSSVAIGGNLTRYALSAC